MRYHEYTNITSLKENQIFVFGSNEAGIHGLGAALTARENFGAETGVGFGPTGQTYAIPTKDKNISTLDVPKIDHYVSMFILYALQNPDKEFLVTRVGCGLAGYTDMIMSKMFVNAGENVILPIEWKTSIEWIQRKLEEAKKDNSHWFIGMDYGVVDKANM